MTEQQDVIEKVKEIKRRFALLMNGVASSSMREKGVKGYINWGVGLPALKDMAAEYGKDYDLALALWKENVRECKILATLMMPHERMSADLISVWTEQTTTQEIAEYATFNVYQYVENASIYAFLWVASSDKLLQLSGYNLFSCLFRRGCEPGERDINEFVDQAVTALSDESVAVRHAAMNSLNNFAAIDEMHQKMVDNALKRCF